MPLAWLSPCFQSLALLPTSKLGPSGADSSVGRLVYVLGPCASLQRTLMWGWEFLPLLQTPQVFIAGGFEALFPWAGSLGCVLCLAPQLFLSVYPHANVGLPALPVLPRPVLQLLPCWVSSVSWLPISAPPTSLGECFFFNFLVVGLPYSSIFWQFWLFFAFKFVVVLLSVVGGGKVYLPMPPPWTEVLL